MADLMSNKDVYENALVTRNASPEMCRIFSPQHRILTWRRVWLTLAESQAELAVGDTVIVSGTGGAGLNMRAGAGTGHAKVKTLREGAEVEIIGGPEDANGYTWWQVRDGDGATGWVVEDYLSN